MFVKIIMGNLDTAVYECSKVLLGNAIDEELELKGKMLVITTEREEIQYLVELGCRVYLLSNNGKTIDSFDV